MTVTGLKVEWLLKAPREALIITSKFNKSTKGREIVKRVKSNQRIKIVAHIGALCEDISI